MKHKHRIFTVGHSNHDQDYFIELIKSQKINCLIDVRSVPASNYNPQYNQEGLQNLLINNGIIYMHSKDEFGARNDDEDVLDENGQVDFELVKKNLIFQQGIERVNKGILKGYQIALMCSEGNPLECHRFSMIETYFIEIGFDVYHILKDKTIKTHQELEFELLKKYKKKLPQPSLFEPDINTIQQLSTAYKLHNQEIGWIPERYKNIDSDD